MRLTAPQDVYGIKPGSGQAEWLLTFLWKFTQTRSTVEVGNMTWRAVNFETRQPTIVEQGWDAENTINEVKVENMHGGHEAMIDCSTSVPHETSLYQQVPDMELEALY